MPGPIFEHVTTPMASSNDDQLQMTRAGYESNLRPVYEVVDIRLPAGDRTLIRTYDRVLVDAYIAGYDYALKPSSSSDPVELRNAGAI